MNLITREKAMSILKVNTTVLRNLQKSGKIKATMLGRNYIYSLESLNKYLHDNSNGRVKYTDELLSTKEALRYLNCTANEFRRLCRKYDFAFYRTNEYKSAKTFYKFEDLKRYKNEFERIKRIKESM